jgi:ribulose-bisphosphate carboxylase large chain
VTRANRETGLQTLYAPSLSGTPEQLRRHARLAREEGVKMALLAPMLLGLPAFEEAVREYLDVAVLAHPALGGLRIAPPLLFGRLYRMLGADAVIFTGYGGRFAYSTERCREIAANCVAPLAGLRSAMPVPAGGMRLERVEELVAFYGPDTMLLIGGDLLIAGDALLDRGREFCERVAKLAA